MNIIKSVVNFLLKPDMSIVTLWATILCVTLFGLWGLIPLIPLVYGVRYLEIKVGWRVTNVNEEE